MSNISKKILEKLSEIEDNKGFPFIHTQALTYPNSKIKYQETEFISFGNSLDIWSRNFLGNGGPYIKQKLELEISSNFYNWLKNFKLSSKDELIEQLLLENRDVLQLRCKRDGSDWEKIEKFIHNDMKKCFKHLK